MLNLRAPPHLWSNLFWLSVIAVFVSIFLGSLTFFGGFIGIRATYLLMVGAIGVVASLVMLQSVPKLFPVWIPAFTVVFLSAADILWLPSGALQAVELTSLQVVFVFAIGASLGFIPRCVLPILTAGVSLFSILLFFRMSEGALIFSDDHPAFLYRLHQLTQNFPNIPFYNTEWNGGVDAREFFPSGVLNVFLIWSGLLYAVDPAHCYNIIVAGTLFALTPAAHMVAARLCGMSKVGMAVAGVLSLLPTLVWYRWGLKYGTMGFVTSMLLLPLTVVLLHRLSSVSRRFTFPSSAGAIVTVTLMALWSLSNIAALPAYLSILARLRSIVGHPNRVMTVVLLVVLNLPWMIVFVRVSPVTRFVAAETKQAQQLIQGQEENLGEEPAAEAGTSESVRDSESFDGIRGFTATLPVLLIVGFLGLFLFEDRGFRLLLGTQIVWLLGLGTLGNWYMPHLELHRMLVVAALVLIVPAARLVEWSVISVSHGTFGVRALTSAVFFGPLCFIPIGLERIIAQRSPESYEFAKPYVAELAKAIKLNAGAGRVLFPSFILHEFSGGHVAPLPWLAGSSLMASSYQHDRWEHHDLIPAFYRRRKDAGILAYIDLYNVTAIVTHERVWRAWFSKRPDHFTPVWRGDRFTIFKVITTDPTYFLEGAGEILRITPRSVAFSLSAPEAVLKFNYLPFLRAGSCTVTAHEMEGDVALVKLGGCPVNEPLVLEGVSAFERVLRKGGKTHRWFRNHQALP